MAGADGSDAWKELALIAITLQGEADVQFVTPVETVDFSLGEKQIEGITTLKGGRIDKFVPETDTTVTFEAYPIQAGTSTADIAAFSGKGFFDLLHARDANGTGELVIENSRTRNKARVAIMFVDSDSITKAESQVVSPTNKAKRFVAADGYFVSVKPSYTDGILKYTCVYKVSPFDLDGNAKIKIESVDGSTAGTLATLASYTSAVKW